MRDILIRARELIADPENWTQHQYAKGPLADPATHCFCMIGAIDRAVLEKLGLERFRDVHDEDKIVETAELDPEGTAALKHVQAQIESFYLISDFNDDADTLHEDVLALLDRSIEACPA